MANQNSFDFCMNENERSINSSRINVFNLILNDMCIVATHFEKNVQSALKLGPT